ncbi:MAG: hypothetical protein E6G74_18955 [Alphaproteobacteria bacterium]|nr:MAG: hypothetical protein E6G74_18955 [Alphaproteobacteria bacterium]
MIMQTLEPRRPAAAKLVALSPGFLSRWCRRYDEGGSLRSRKRGSRD